MFGAVHQLVGLALLCIFAFSVREMTKKRKQPIALEIEKDSKRIGRKNVLLKVIVGVALVIGMAELIITSASNVSTAFGVAPIFMGAKVIAIGTSIPELALDLTAVRRGRIHLALGDLIGSNLTNITLVFGIVLLASPVEVIDLSLFAQVVPFVLITTLILWRYLTKGGVSQFGGVILILTYIVFQAVIVA